MILCKHLIIFGKIYPSLLAWRPINDITHASLLEDISHSERVREIFASFLPDAQEMLAKTSQRLDLLQKISFYVGNRADNNGMLVNKIGLSWDKFLQLATSNEAELADFVYLRYAVEENNYLNTSFNELLAEYNLSRVDFDAFFTANKQHYADLRRRKDIINRLIETALPQQQDVINGILYYADTKLGPTHPETQLKELLALLGVERDDFVQEIANLTSRFGWPPVGGITYASMPKDIVYNESKRNRLFASVLSSKEKLKSNSPRLVLLQQISQHAGNTNALPVNEIEPIWDKFLQLATNDTVELADFVHLRYAVGKNSDLEALFNKLLTKHNLSRADFDMFFAAHKHHYVDLTRHEDIIDGIFEAALISANNLMRERLFRSIGIDEGTYIQYANMGGDITDNLIDIQATIGDDKDLNAIFAELLAEQGITREEFEQALSDVIDVYRNWWSVLLDLPYFTSDSLPVKLEHLIPEERKQILEIITARDHHYYDEAYYFHDLITKAEGKTSPAKAKRRSDILKKMSDIASTTRAVATATSDSVKTGKGTIELDLSETEHTKRGFMKLGLNTKVVMDFITANEQYPYDDYSYPYLDVFIIMHHAVDQDTLLQTQLTKTPLSPHLKEMNTKLQTLFTELLAEYGWSKDKFERFLDDNYERVFELTRG